MVSMVRLINQLHRKMTSTSSSCPALLCSFVLGVTRSCRGDGLTRFIARWRAESPLIAINRGDSGLWFCQVSGVDPVVLRHGSIATTVTRSSQQLRRGPSSPRNNALVLRPPSQWRRLKESSGCGTLTVASMLSCHSVNSTCPNIL